MKEHSSSLTITRFGIHEIVKAICKTLLLFTFLANGLDAILTLLFIVQPRGIEESNPFIQYILETSTFAFVMLKAVLVPMLILLIFEHVERVIAQIASVIVFLSYVFVLYAWFQVIF